MHKFHLCESCAGRFKRSSAVGDAKRESGCHICRGSLRLAGQLVRSALERSKEFEWRTFSVSSSFPREVFVREEQVADYFLPGEWSSIKNTANSILAEAIFAATGRKNDQRNGEAIFSFDFASGKAGAMPAPLFVFGHYLKLSRKHCQSRWHCPECGGRGCASCRDSCVNYPSVEDGIGSALVAAFAAKGCALHASGREDVDVRMLGNGRPFVMELKSPRKRGMELSAIERRIFGNQNVRAVGLRFVRRHFIEAVCGSHFEKEYSALVSADRLLALEDARKAEALSGAVLLQRTPKRVLSRRSDLERRRKILKISARDAKDGKIRLEFFAEAGTYIKELVSSDGGRTRPSLAEALGCKAVCEELDVIHIHDYFLETISD